MPSFWGELKKRNVVKVAVAYFVIAWLLIEVVATVFPALKLPEWGVTMVIVLLFIGAPVALLLAWAYELTPNGVERAAPTLSRRQLLIGSASIGVIALGLSAAAYKYVRLRPSVAPNFRRLTFRRGMIRNARFMPDYQTVLYGALWDGDDCRVYAVSPASPESAPLDLAPATPLAVSKSGEIAIALGRHYRGVMTYGTLARVPLAGGTPRELMEDVKFADWSPDGTELAVVRRVGNRDRLEYPIGTVLAESLPGSGNVGGFSFPRVSQDGSRVAFFDLTGGLAGSVAVVDRAGGKITLATGYRQLFGLAWNGQEVWFTAADERPLLRDAIMAGSGLGQIFVVDTASGQRQLWRDIRPLDPAGLMGHGTGLVVSPDGQSYAYSWHRALSNLYIVEGLA